MSSDNPAYVTQLEQTLATLRTWAASEYPRLQELRAGFRDGTVSAAYLDGALGQAAKLWLMLVPAPPVVAPEEAPRCDA